MKSAQIRYQEDPLRGLGQKAQEKGDWWAANLVLYNAEFRPEKTVTHLRVTLDDQLKWKEHIQKLRGKCFALQQAWLHLKEYTETYTLGCEKEAILCTDNSHMLMIVVWYGTIWQLTVEREQKVEAIQNAGLRFILRAPRTVTDWVEAESRMDHSGTKRKLYALKMVHPQGRACISPSQVPVHLWPKEIDKPRDRSLANFILADQGQSTTNNHLNIQLQNFAVQHKNAECTCPFCKSMQYCVR